MNRNKQQLLSFIAFILGDETRYSQVGIEMLTHSPQNEKKDIGNIRGMVRIPISFHPVESRGFYAGKKRDESDAEAVRKYRSEDVPSLKS